LRIVVVKTSNKENKKMDFHVVITCLALKQALSRIPAIVAARNIFGWSLGESRENFGRAVHDRAICDNHILQKAGDIFLLHSGDRTIFVTEEYLSQCSPEKRAEVESIMQSLTK
jgi:hypothetical protein